MQLTICRFEGFRSNLFLPGNAARHIEKRCVQPLLFIKFEHTVSHMKVAIFSLMAQGVNFNITAWKGLCIVVPLLNGHFHKDFAPKNSYLCTFFAKSFSLVFFEGKMSLLVDY